MNTEKYLIGFNIGPIYEVMKHSKKTRELWFGSYLFSMLIKMVYEKLSKSRYTIIKPYYEEVNKEKSTAGLFPDRIVAIASNNVDKIKTDIDKIVKEVKGEFSKIIVNLISLEIKRSITDTEGTDHKAAKIIFNSTADIINEYLQLDYVIIPQGTLDDKDIIKEVESFLDAVEVNRSFALGKNEPTCYRCKSLPAIVEVFEQWETPANQNQKLCPFCFIKLRSHFSKEIQELTGIEDKKPFPALRDISAVELKEKYPLVFTEYEDNEEKELFEDQRIKVKNYHKYYALFMADGDNLSKVSKNLKTPEELSKYLFDFGNRVYSLSKNEYHGEPIYIGGDDIFAIMPFAFSDQNGIKTVFDFALKINNEYDRIVSQKIRADEDKTSLSIGIVIAYYKYPLAMALEEVQKQLFEVAKQIKGKNGLAVKFIQHSGAESKFACKFNDPILSTYTDLYKIVLTSGKRFPAVHHKIDTFKALFINLENESQLENLLTKRFYEGFTDDEQKERFKVLMKKTLIKFLKGKEAEKELERVSDMLHILKFIKGEK
ncbi:MAG: type III-B CRISPR-associated protein Cas10/Cmr2 [Bacteroidota bacterium]